MRAREGRQAGGGISKGSESVQQNRYSRESCVAFISVHSRGRVGRRRRGAPSENRNGSRASGASKGARVDNKWSKIKIKLVHLNKLINSGGRERKDQLHKMHKQQNTTTTRRVFVS